MRATLGLLGLTVATLDVETDRQWDWYLDHPDLSELLDRAHHGETPGVLLAELWANAEH